MSQLTEIKHSVKCSLHQLGNYNRIITILKITWHIFSGVQFTPLNSCEWHQQTHCAKNNTRCVIQQRAADRHTNQWEPLNLKNRQPWERSPCRSLQGKGGMVWVSRHSLAAGCLHGQSAILGEIPRNGPVQWHLTRLAFSATNKRRADKRLSLGLEDNLSSFPTAAICPLALMRFANQYRNSTIKYL